MHKSDVVVILERIGMALELDDANPFEVLAFKNGAQHLADWEGDLREAVSEGTLTDIYGIGKGLASVIVELVQTDKSAKYVELCRLYPKTLFDLFQIPGLGPSRIRILHKQLRIDSLDAREQSAKAGRIRALQGFGAQTEERILRGIETTRRRLD